MPINYLELKKEGIESAKSFKAAKRVAEKLRDFLNQKRVEDEIIKRDVPDTPSEEIARIIHRFAVKQGFVYEKTGVIPGFRSQPDFFNSEKKIVLEVERGKTHMNNTDLLDMWKCHFSQARYLFLAIPKARRSRKGKVVKQFRWTKDKLAEFFRVKKNYVNVDAVFLFGYGSDS